MPQAKNKNNNDKQIKNEKQKHEQETVKSLAVCNRLNGSSIGRWQYVLDAAAWIR